TKCTGGLSAKPDDAPFVPPKVRHTSHGEPRMLIRGSGRVTLRPRCELRDTGFGIWVLRYGLPCRVVVSELFGCAFVCSCLKKWAGRPDARDATRRRGFRSRSRWWAPPARLVSSPPVLKPGGGRPDCPPGITDGSLDQPPVVPNCC